MNNGVLIWVIIFAVSATVFFLISVVVTIKGFFDMRLLLRHSDLNGGFEPESEVAEKGAELKND